MSTSPVTSVRRVVSFLRSVGPGLAALALSVAVGQDASAQVLAKQPGKLEFLPNPPLNHNVELIGELAPAGLSTRYGDVWGYRDPTTGKEYALLSGMGGVHVINCSVPEAPFETGFIPTPRNIDFNGWRDVKTFGPFAYSVSQGFGGLQIIDLRDPDNPELIRLWGEGLWAGAHNLQVDPVRGHLWVMATESGTQILDIGTNPTQPSHIFTLAQPYSFDVQIQGDYAYYADLWGNQMIIYNVTQLPEALPIVSATRMPGTQLGHSAWPSADGRICVTTNEAAGGPVGIFDITDKTNPQLISTYVANPTTSPDAVPHHVYLEDRIAHISYWTEGYRVLDLTTPSNPQEIGYYDTNRSPQRTHFKGAWGCYHMQPSGIVYVGDTERGLLLLRPRAVPTIYGEGTLGGSARAIEVGCFGSSFLGNAGFRVNADNAPPLTAGVAILGRGRASVNVLNFKINVSLGPVPAVTIPIASNEFGKATFPMPLPNVRDLDGVKLNLQFFFADPGGPTGSNLATSRGLEIDLFRP